MERGKVLPDMRSTISIAWSYRDGLCIFLCCNPEPKPPLRESASEYKYGLRLSPYISRLVSTSISQLLHGP